MDLDPADRDLLTKLREMLEDVDPVPASAVEAAKAGLAWRTLDAELAKLTEDTVLSGAAVRSRRPPRMLTFTTDDTTVLVEVTAERDGRRLLGQVVLGPLPVSVEVRHSEGSVTVDADEYGRFQAAAIPPGLMSLACQFDTAPPVATSWVPV